MKKILLVLIVLIFSATSSFSLIDLTSYIGQGSSYFKPLLDFFATGANSGLATSSRNTSFISAGIQLNMTINPGDDILSEAGNTDNYQLPLLYANIRFGRFTIFARGLMIDQEGVKFEYYGGGVSFTLIKMKKIFPRIRILGAYHKLVADEALFKVSAISANVVAEYKLPIPLLSITVFASGGWEHNMLETTWNEGTYGNNFDITEERVRAAVGVEFRLFKLLGISYEYTIIPNANHNISASVQF